MDRAYARTFATEERVRETVFHEGRLPDQLLDMIEENKSDDDRQDRPCDDRGTRHETPSDSLAALIVTSNDAGPGLSASGVPHADRGRLTRPFAGSCLLNCAVEPSMRIELMTSSLPRTRSATELRGRAGRSTRSRRRRFVFADDLHRPRADDAVQSIEGIFNFLAAQITMHRPAAESRDRSRRDPSRKVASYRSSRSPVTSRRFRAREGIDTRRPHRDTL